MTVSQYDYAGSIRRRPVIGLCLDAAATGDGTVKKTFCDMCELPVEKNIVKDIQCGSVFAGYHVAVNLKINTDGDFCADCLSEILRNAITPGSVTKNTGPLQG